MDTAEMKALTQGLAKGIKSEQDLNRVMRELMKLTVETALSAELDEHFGYEKHQAKSTATRVTDAPQRH